ncbi:MAG: PadR family transcriptional regulator [Acidimicrobiia bacterium]
MKPSKELVAASATPIVLSVLADGDSYGYELLQKIRDRSNGQLDWKEGMMYPLLHRLEQGGLISGYDGIGPTGRRRRYYRITPKGRRSLTQHRDHIHSIAAVLGLLPSPATGAQGV